MPIELGIGMSHAGSIRMANLEVWEPYYQRFIRNTPQPAGAAAETPEVLSGYIHRIQASLAELRRRLEVYKPDLLIVIGGDQSEVFDRSNVPQLMIYLGPEVHGYEIEGRDGDQTKLDIAINVDEETSRWLLKKLVKEEGFDVAFSAEQQSLAERRGGGRAEGVSHAFWRPAVAVFGSEVPTVLVWENTYDPPSLTARRCYELGKTLEKLFRNDGRRVAILGSGGLSHDPGGPRSGWIDEPLDRWVISQFEEGNGAQTQAMYTFDSATMASGTGEIRAWITTAGAMEAIGTHFDLIDYVPVHHGLTGLAFGTWAPPALMDRFRQTAAASAGGD